MSTTRTPESALLISGRLGRLGADIFVPVPLRDQARVLEDVEGDVERGPRDLDVRRPTAELLIGGDGRGQDGPVDAREELGLCLRDLRGRRGADPRARLAIGAHEPPGHVGAQPLARGAEPREGAGADRLADRRHDVADAVVLQLLRRRALLMDVVALALPEGLVHLAARNVDGTDSRVVEPAAVAGVLEHDERLAAVIDEDLRALPLVPRERRIGPARREEKAVLLVDLREVHRRRRLTLLEGSEALRGRGLADVHCAVHQALDRRLTGRRHGMRGPQPLRLEKPAGEGRDQRRVKSREAGELDTDLVAQWTLPGTDDSNIGRMARRGALTRPALWTVAAVLGGCTVGGLQGPTIATTTPAGTPEWIPIQIQKPDGARPFPAVVMRHDCSGLGPRASGAPGRWATELVGRGYVVLMPDSFTTRGFPAGVCTTPSPRRTDVGPSRRVRDAYAALAHLRTLPFVDGSRVGLMGGSQGGATTLAAMVAPSESLGFRAAVALYPGCAPWLRSAD